MLRLDRETLNDRAYGALKQGLISGDFGPGQVLVIRKLADTLGISTTPIREALQRLVAERLLELRQNRSTAVPLLSSGTFRELARIRSAIEGLAAEMATGRVEDSDLHRIRQLLAGMDQAIGNRDGQAYLRLNEEFHFAIYALSGAPLLLTMIGDLWGRVGPYMRFLMETESYVPQSNAHHRQIVTALEGRDGEAARRFVVEDITAAAEALLPRLAPEPV